MVPEQVRGVDLAGARPSSAALHFLGVSKTQWGALPLPLDLTFAGAPGCSLHASLELVLAAATDASGKASVAFAVPPNAALLCLSFYNQFAVFDPAANALGLSFTNGGMATIGNQ